MMRMFLKPLLSIAAALGVVGSARAGEADLVRVFNQAELVFVGQVAEWAQGPVGRSWPPVYTGTVTFEKVTVVRGKAGGRVTVRYSIRSKVQPTFKRGAKQVVAARRQADHLVLVRSLEATEANLALAKSAAGLLPGWSREKGKPVSPWAKLGRRAWPQGATLNADVVCSKTGRPALTTNTGVVLRVEPVIPKTAHKFRNPQGDGRFKLTVTNTNPVPVDVGALLTDGGKIAWADSLVFLHGGKALLHPAAGRLTRPTATRLKAGQGVSTVIDTLPIEGITWPRGGWRVHFTFCLGERTANGFFYYLSRHHDPLRKAAVQALKAR